MAAWAGYRDFSDSESSSTSSDVSDMPQRLVGQTPISRHTDYYFEDGNVVILVETTLFRVFRSTFTRHSVVFKDLFSLPKPAGYEAEGSSDANPLFLSGIVAVDFERLLWILYPPTYGAHKAETLEEWTSILHLATRWDFNDIRSLALKNIQAMDVEPVDAINLSRYFDISGRWTLSAYMALCERPQPLSFAEANCLGLETSVRISQLREQLRGGRPRRWTTTHTPPPRTPAGRQTPSAHTGHVASSADERNLQWDIARSFLDQGKIPPPVRANSTGSPLKRSVTLTPGKRISGSGPTLPRNARLVAEAFGLDIGGR